MRVSKRTGIIGSVSLAAAAAVGTFLAVTGPTVVPAGANLQEYINNASPGTVLELPPDGVYTGNFTMRSGVAIKSVGTRVVGAAFGKTFNVGAKIVSPNAGAAVYFPPGTTSASIEGVEIAHTGFIYNIVVIGGQGAEQDVVEEAPRDITLNNVWIRGHPTEHSQNGIVDNGSNTRITNYRIDNIHGVGVESHGIISWNGPGPFYYADGYVEAAGINIMWGGAVPSIPNLIPTGIQVRGNHLFKPLSWKVGHETYAGIHWGVKNLLELKVGKDVIIDRNVLENCWVDAQVGYAVLLTVRGDNGKTPWNTLQNITFTNNVVKNSEQGLQLLGLDDGGASVRASGLLIRNNLFENITSRFLTMSGYYNVTMEHNTHFQRGNITALYNEPSLNFVYRNNVTVKMPDTYGFFGDGTGEGLAAITKFLPGAVIEGNVIAGATARLYPPDNHFPADLSGLANLRGTDGLVPGYSPQLQPLPSPSATATVTVSPSPALSPEPTAPPADGPSENNTRIPTATKITDNSGNVWTLSGTRMLRNGVETGGYGSALLWCGSRIYGKGEDLLWYQYANPGWARVGADPCASASPSPTATSTPVPTQTPTPQPVPTATATPSPVCPAVPLCTSGQIVGNPPQCLCRSGMRGDRCK